MNGYKPTVVFDFDGVIHSYRSGWKGAVVIPDPVVPGIADAICRLRTDGYRVVVVSTRCSSGEGMKAVVDYLANNQIAVDDVLAEKPPAICYIDDRAIRFDGDASVIVEQVKAFHSWTEGPQTMPECESEAIRNITMKIASQPFEPCGMVDPRGISKLRPCEAAVYNNGEKIPVRGWFHGWAADFMEFNDGIGNLTLAIIEQKDGKVVTCQPDTVQFLDGGAPHITELMVNSGETRG